ncbi:MAG: 3-phosphoshikimate 1-carboxyvinyltransferase [Spirochaetia bacterium]|nr:3-phosphoshikimate 1-carboxyvinyltransferase [Spirochaetia bacterium]
MRNSGRKSYAKQKTLPVELTLKRTEKFQGSVALPGSKSIANRALLLAAVCGGKTEITGLPDAEDVEVLLRNLPTLGIRTEISENLVLVHGCNGPFPVEFASLRLENAGTALRPLVALLCAGHGNFTIDGNDQMRNRPIGDLVRGLARLGINITAIEKTVLNKTDLYPPVKIQSTGFPGGETVLSGAVSSQFISAFLLAAPFARKPVRLVIAEEPVSKPYIDLTIHMMQEFSVRISRRGYAEFEIEPQQYKTPGVYRVEADATAATYFMSLGALAGPVTISSLGRDSAQGDVKYANLLRQMGANVEHSGDRITVRRGTLNGIDIDMNDMPDAAMTLAVLALFAKGTTTIRNIANLRVKESERIRGLATELTKLGAEVEEGEDSLTVHPPAQLKPARIETYKDHRMAMAFSLASFGTDVTILDPDCVRKTYTHYFRDYFAVAGQHGRP